MMEVIKEKRVLTTLELTDMQKQVLGKIMIAPTPSVAAQNIAKDQKMITARDILSHLGLIEVSDENGASVTDKGKQVMTDQGLMDQSGGLTDEGNKFAYGDSGKPSSQAPVPQPPEEDLDDVLGSDESQMPTESFNLLKDLSDRSKLF